MRSSPLHAVLVLALAGVGVALREPRWPAFGGAASVGAFVLAGRREWTSSGRFGIGNAVTSIRLVLVLVLAVLPGAGWAAASVLSACFLLDGADGFLARRAGAASAFGATFDMETDALMVLVATMQLAATARFPALVVAPGLLRYLYAVSLFVFPGARGEEPRSSFARVAYAGFVTSLVLCLLPLGPVTGLVFAAGASLLALSFARSWFHAFQAGAEVFHPGRGRPSPR